MQPATVRSSAEQQAAEPSCLCSRRRRRCHTPGARVPCSMRTPLDLTGRTQRCLNLGSYNYLGFAAADEYCTPRVLDMLADWGISSCSPRTEAGEQRRGGSSSRRLGVAWLLQLLQLLQWQSQQQQGHSGAAPPAAPPADTRAYAFTCAPPAPAPGRRDERAAPAAGGARGCLCGQGGRHHVWHGLCHECSRHPSAGGAGHAGAERLAKPHQHRGWRQGERRGGQGVPAQ